MSGWRNDKDPKENQSFSSQRFSSGLGCTVVHKLPRARVHSNCQSSTKEKYRYEDILKQQEETTVDVIEIVGLQAQPKGMQKWPKTSQKRANSTLGRIFLHNKKGLQRKNAIKMRWARILGEMQPLGSDDSFQLQPAWEGSMRADKQGMTSNARNRSKARRGNLGRRHGVFAAKFPTH